MTKDRDFSRFAIEFVEVNNLEERNARNIELVPLFTGASHKSVLRWIDQKNRIGTSEPQRKRARNAVKPTNEEHFVCAPRNVIIGASLGIRGNGW